MKKRTLILTLAGVLAGAYAITQVYTPANDTGTTTTESNQPCAYNWAYESLPDLSADFETQVRALDPSASAQAKAYGEDCTAADGTSTFGAMETDFYVQVRAADLTDFESFGNWIARVAGIIDALPPEKISGPQLGFVEFSFTKTESDFLVVRIPLRDYHERANGLTGAELFNLFYQAP